MAKAATSSKAGTQKEVTSMTREPLVQALSRRSVHLGEVILLTGRDISCHVLDNTLPCSEDTREPLDKARTAILATYEGGVIHGNLSDGIYDLSVLNPVAIIAGERQSMVTLPPTTRYLSRPDESSDASYRVRVSTNPAAAELTFGQRQIMRVLRTSGLDRHGALNDFLGRYFQEHRNVQSGNAD